MKYRCYQVTPSVKHFYTNRERCEVMTGYLSPRRRPGGDWANTWHWYRTFCKRLFKQDVTEDPHLLPYRIPQESFFSENKFNTQRLYIIVWIKNDNTVINRLASELFLLILAHPVYKMWIIQEPNTLELWHKLHFEEKKTESIYHF